MVLTGQMQTSSIYFLSSSLNYGVFCRSLFFMYASQLMSINYYNVETIVFNLIVAWSIIKLFKNNAIKTL